MRRQVVYEMFINRESSRLRPLRHRGFHNGYD